MLCGGFPLISVGLSIEEKRREMSEVEVKVGKSDSGGQRAEERKGYPRIQREEGFWMDEDRTRAQHLLERASISPAVRLKSVWFQGDLRHTFREEKERERRRMDIDGWFHGLFCTLACRSGQAFFPVLQIDVREDRDNALLPGKTGSCKENKIKFTSQP